MQARAPWVMVVMSIVYAAIAYPAGSRPIAGQAVHCSPRACCAHREPTSCSRSPRRAGVLAGAALWGLHMGLTQGLLAALVAATAPRDLRGTAFGVFNLVSGVALLIASTLAGWLWDAYGPALTFYAGAGFTALAGLGLALRKRDVAALAHR